MIPLNDSPVHVVQVWRWAQFVSLPFGCYGVVEVAAAVRFIEVLLAGEELGVVGARANFFPSSFCKSIVLITHNVNFRVPDNSK